MRLILLGENGERYNVRKTRMGWEVKEGEAVTTYPTLLALMDVLTPVGTGGDTDE